MIEVQQTTVRVGSIELKSCFKNAVIVIALYTLSSVAFDPDNFLYMIEIRHKLQYGWRWLNSTAFVIPNRKWTGLEKSCDSSANKPTSLEEESFQPTASDQYNDQVLDALSERNESAFFIL